MIPAEALGAFSSYDLGRLIAAMAAEAAEHPEAPATQVLRAAAVRFLPWDHYNATAWDDPMFPPRFEFLREFVVSAGLPLPVSAALAPLRDLFDQVCAHEVA